MRKAVIIPARCSKTKGSFGIRLEEISTDTWSAVWAFKLSETSVKREGYDNVNVKGTFNLSHEYPGCPFCEANSYVLCNCGKVSCWNSNIIEFTCPNCGIHCRITFGGINNLNVSQNL